MNEMVTASSCESDFPTLLAVFEGTDLGHLHRIGAPVPQGGRGCRLPFDEFSFPAQAGTTYAVGIDGDGYYVPGHPGGPRVGPPSGEGRVMLRIEPSVLSG